MSSEELKGWNLPNLFCSAETENTLCKSISAYLPVPVPVDIAFTGSRGQFRNRLRGIGWELRGGRRRAWPQPCLLRYGCEPQTFGSKFCNIVTGNDLFVHYNNALWCKWLWVCSGCCWLLRRQAVISALVIWFLSMDMQKSWKNMEKSINNNTTGNRRWWCLITTNPVSPSNNMDLVFNNVVFWVIFSTFFITCFTVDLCPERNPLFQVLLGTSTCNSGEFRGKFFSQVFPRVSFRFLALETVKPHMFEYFWWFFHDLSTIKMNHLKEKHPSHIFFILFLKTTHSKPRKTRLHCDVEDSVYLQTKVRVRSPRLSVTYTVNEVWQNSMVLFFCWIVQGFWFESIVLSRTISNPWVFDVPTNSLTKAWYCWRLL